MSAFDCVDRKVSLTNSS